MAIEKLYRKANVSRSDALDGLFQARPEADLVSFTRVAQVNGEIVADPRGPYYEVVLKTAEFPPVKDEEDAADDDASAAKDEASADSEVEKADTDEEKADDAPEGDSPIGAPSEEKPKKLNPQEETVSLLRQILHAIQGDKGGLGGPSPDGDLGDVVPDIGAPPAGGMPPKGGPAGGPPLPPPVPKKPGMPGGAFASVAEPFRKDAATKDTFNIVRAGVLDDRMGHRALIAEANKLVPTHKVTQLTLDGNEARLELTRR